MKRALSKDSKMSSDAKSTPKSVIDEIYQELYLINNCKRPLSAFLDEELIVPNPGAHAVPEGHLSKKQKHAVPEGHLSKKQKVMKPTKKFKGSSPTSGKFSVPIQKAECDPLIEASAKTCKTVEKPKAIPKSNTTKKGKAKVNECLSSSFQVSYDSREMADFLYARHLTKSDLHLRSSSKEVFEYSDVVRLCDSLILKREFASAESVNQNSNPSPEIPREVAEKDPVEITPEQISANNIEKKDEKENPISGSSPDKNNFLSPESTDTIGQKKPSADTALKATNVLKLQGGHQVKPEKAFLQCDKKLAKKLFGGRRYFLLEDIKEYLRKCLILSDKVSLKMI